MLLCCACHRMAELEEKMHSMAGYTLAMLRMAGYVLAMLSMADYELLTEADFLVDYRDKKKFMS